MISIAKTANTKMVNQLLLHSPGAKNPKMYSMPPAIAKRLVRETLNASFKCVDEMNKRTIPLNIITTLFK